MRAARSSTRPSRCGPSSTPMRASSLDIVATSIRRGTLSSTSGFSVNSAAHMIGSAAFFAPETRISPSSGPPPVMRSLSTGAPLLRRQGAHRQRVDLLAHSAAERAVHELVALHPAAAFALARHDQSLEVLPVARDLEVLAREARRNALLDAFRRHHLPI